MTVCLNSFWITVWIRDRRVKCQLYVQKTDADPQKFSQKIQEMSTLADQQIDACKRGDELFSRDLRIQHEKIRLELLQMSDLNDEWCSQIPLPGDLVKVSLGVEKLPTPLGWDPGLFPDLGYAISVNDEISYVLWVATNTLEKVPTYGIERY